MRIRVLSLLFVVLAAANLHAQTAPVAVTANWDKVTRVSVTVPTTQHLANSFTVRGHRFNKPLLQALQNLHTNDTRVQLWFSVPNQAVPELREPTATETFWDFRYLDPVVLDFYAHTAGRRHVNIGTIPRWMFDVPVAEVPSDPAASFYGYTRGTNADHIKDPTGRQFADYQLRIFQWYTQGGFTDELGKFHKSGHHLKIEYWGIMNEPNFENRLTPALYTRMYDATAIAIHKVDPSVQFFGPEVLGNVTYAWALYFLDPKNHDPAAPPVQWFSLHNYVLANNDPATWQSSYFLNKKSDGSAVYFEELLEKVIHLRDHYSPGTKIGIDELGTFDQVKPKEDGGQADEPYNAYHPLYWVATGANWAANYISAARLGVPLISMTQMLGYPTQSPSTSMVDWENGKPNAHYWVLYLIAKHFGPGDKLVDTQSGSSDIFAQAAITSTGRKLLLVNTSDHRVTVHLAGPLVSLQIEVVDERSAEQPPRKERGATGDFTLAPFATAVVTIK